MVATATIPPMAKGGEVTTINVQGRLTPAEVQELDAAAASMPVPVTRGALVGHILREWLKARREAGPAPSHKDRGKRG